MIRPLPAFWAWGGKGALRYMGPREAFIRATWAPGRWSGNGNARTCIEEIGEDLVGEYFPGTAWTLWDNFLEAGYDLNDFDTLIATLVPGWVSSIQTGRSHLSPTYAGDLVLDIEYHELLYVARPSDGISGAFQSAGTVIFDTNAREEKSALGLPSDEPDLTEAIADLYDDCWARTLGPLLDALHTAMPLARFWWYPNALGVLWHSEAADAQAALIARLDWLFERDDVGGIIVPATWSYDYVPGSGADDPGAGTLNDVHFRERFGAVLTAGRAVADHYDKRLMAYQRATEAGRTLDARVPRLFADLYAAAGVDDLVFWASRSGQTGESLAAEQANLNVWARAIRGRMNQGPRLSVAAKQTGSAPTLAIPSAGQ